MKNPAWRDTPSAGIALEPQPDKPTLTIMFRAPMAELPTQLSGCFAAILGYLKSRGRSPAGPRFAMYRNLDGRMAEVEAGFPVANYTEGREDIVPGMLRACDAATALHVGPYSQLGGKYAELALWITRRGLRIDGPFTEFYLNDPDTTLPELLQTKIVIPVKSDAGAGFARPQTLP